MHHTVAQLGCDTRMTWSYSALTSNRFRLTGTYTTTVDFGRASIPPSRAGVPPDPHHVHISTPAAVSPSAKDEGAQLRGRRAGIGSHVPKRPPRRVFARPFCRDARP